MFRHDAMPSASRRAGSAEPVAAHSIWRALGRPVLSAAPLLRGLTWQRIAYTVLVAAGFALWTAVGQALLQLFGPGGRWVGLGELFLNDNGGWLMLFKRYLPPVFLQMLALTIADNVPASGIRRWSILVLALVVGTLAGVVCYVLLNDPNALQMPLREFVVDWTHPTVSYLMHGAMIAVVFFSWRRDSRVAAALHQAELTRVDLQRKTLESELQTMQAQVEPQFLFDTLERIENLYESDFSAADRMLDSLILYLRAALPQMRSSESTLGKEVDLVRAYTAIERGNGDESLDLAVHVPEDLTGVAFPPMVLLPLVDALTPHGLSDAHDHGALRMDASAGPGNLRVTLARGGTTEVRMDTLDAIRDRLAALYGAGATLELTHREPHAVTARLEIPHVVS